MTFDLQWLVAPLLVSGAYLIGQWVGYRDAEFRWKGSAELYRRSFEWAVLDRRKRRRTLKREFAALLEEVEERS